LLLRFSDKKIKNDAISDKRGKTWREENGKLTCNCRSCWDRRSYYSYTNNVSQYRRLSCKKLKVYTELQCRTRGTKHYVRL